MKKENLLFTSIISAGLLFSAMTLAQDPVYNIDKNLHPNLAEAQRLVIQAHSYVKAAQKDNRYDMHGHCTSARNLLVQVNEQLKLAAEDANAAASQKK